MDNITSRFVSFLFSLFVSFVLVKGFQWVAVEWFDWQIPGIWDRVLFVVITFVFWAPWRKSNVPKNAGNNDLFPGQ